MNAYGDPQSARARVQVPGPSAATTPGGDPADESRPGPDAYRRPPGAGSAGRASVGSASVGAAPVGGRAAVGSAAPGRASVGAAPVGGRASVGAGPIGGRASVPPVGPGGPSGPGGPGGGGSGGSGGGGKKGRSKAAKKHRRANILTAAAAVLVIMLGVGIVGGTYFFDDIKLPPPKAEEQMNTILTADNKLLQRTGEPRINVPYQQISKVMQDAAAAAEDKNFWKHNGIDMKGIARAAWNNFTGGDLQGASTITQQYARHVADEKDISYSRKLREAVIARKLESEYEKSEIMGMYLNFIDLGRGRYGVESAAQGYFKASVVAGAKNEINPYQAAVLASVIKQPYATASHKGYDPDVNPTDAKIRWEYTLKNMLEMGAITQEQYDKREYPKVEKATSSNKNNIEGKPIGMVMRHVVYELNQLGISEEELNQGGYTITTTINPKVQAAAEKAGSRLSKTSPLYKRPDTYQAAVIGVDPGSGEVLAYYGGDDPTGTDYAGYMSGDGTGVVKEGGQSPGSTFKLYTLAAGLKADISFETVWDATKRKADGKEISNAGADDQTLCGGKSRYCDLETATVKSYNFPFYWIADTLGQEKVIEAARDAGVGTMWNDDGEKIDLTTAKADKMTSNFDREVAFGQYRVVPLDHAQGVATIVNGGVRHEAHFVKQVKQRDPKTGAETVKYTAPQKGKRVFDAAQMSNLLGVMKKIPVAANNTISGRESVGKSGTWEIKVGNKRGSGDTWFVGGIPQLAATVWVGGSGNRIALKETDGDNMFGSGTPAAIWEEFIETTAEAMKWDEEKFPERIKTGDDSKGNGVKPPPEPDKPATDQNSDFCQFYPDSNLCKPSGGNPASNGAADNGGANNGYPANNGGGDEDDDD